MAIDASLDELLRHAGWARALARQLVLDEPSADDVVQQAWLAAVEKPPQSGPGLRAWLAQLIRNVAHNERRAQARRLQHERNAAPPEASVPPSASLADEFAAQQLVADALLRLDEPYRETLLRRWYRDEKPAAIARVMAVPVKTVETRLARGIERLRGALTELRGSDGGGGVDWRQALLPLALHAPAGGGIAALTATIAAGVTAMTATGELVAGGALASAALVTWICVRDDARPEAKGSVAVARAEPSFAAAADDASDPITTTDEAAATRAAEPRQATDAAAPKPDLLAGWRKDGRLHGRVLSSETRLPIAGATVNAQVPNLWSGPLATTTSDANGEFLLERLYDEIRLTIASDGHFSIDRKLSHDELSLPVDAAVVDYLLEPRKYATLICRLRSSNGAPIPERVRTEATLRLEAMSDDVAKAREINFDPKKMVAVGKSYESGATATRSGETFRFDRVAAGFRLEVHARLGKAPLGSLTVDALAPDTTLEIDFPIACGILVPVEFVDATTLEPIAMASDDYWSKVTLRWTGAEATDHLARTCYASTVSDGISLPSAGRLELDCSARGFAPATVREEVADGSRVTIPLTRWRELEVRVRTPEGEPFWFRAIDDFGKSPTTRVSGGGSLSFFGSELDLRVVLARDPLPDRIAEEPGDTNRGLPSHAKGKGRTGIDGFKVFVPFEWVEVGIYADDELVATGSVDASATSVEVEIDVAPPAIGALRFQVVDPAGKCVTSYRVQLERFLGPNGDHAPNNICFEVTDPLHGAFSWDRLCEGNYRVRIQPGALRSEPDLWVGRAIVTGAGDTDLGTLQLTGEGALQVRVVDDADAPIAGAVLTLFPADSNERLEFSHSEPNRMTATTNEQGALPRFAYRSLALRVEARAAGFEPGATLVTVAASSAPTACKVVLRSSPRR